MLDKCFYCDDTGYIPSELEGIPHQMCPYCEIGQAVIKGYNRARDIGIQACDTLGEAKDQRIKELEDLLDEFADAPGCMRVPDWVVLKCEQALKGE